MGCRLGILVSHPIQYYAPWFRYLAERMDIEVFYAHQQDARGQSQAGFGVEFEWDVPLLDGYPYRWLANVARRPGLSSFWGCDTPELYDIIRRERFDAFLVFGWNRKSSLQAIRACWRSGVPVLVRGDSQLGTHRSWLKVWAKALPYRWLLPRLDGHLYVGQRNRAYLEHYGVPHDRLFFAPHFVDNAVFARRASEAEASGRTHRLRAELRIPSDAFVFLFVGKLIPKKRPQDFIEACLRVVDAPDGARVHGVLVGDGPLRPALEGLAGRRPGRIHFAGFRNQSELPAWYRAADALVLPSASETWGLVVNEAFACGIPAIVSDALGCAPDLIEEGETGFTYPVGNVEALARRMLALMADLERRPTAVWRAIARKVEQYSMERATAGLEEALARVVR